MLLDVLLCFGLREKVLAPCGSSFFPSSNPVRELEMRTALLIDGSQVLVLF